MSSLIFYSDAQQVLVATDTLGVDANGSPMLFTSKAHYLPHIRTVVAGTGMGGFAGDWAICANNRMVIRGLENLDYHTPDALGKLWAKYRAEYSLSDTATTTVYQWGFSEDTGVIVGYAYRSTSNFKSEKLEYGIGVKPECTVPEGNILEHLESMMHEQRVAQDTQPPEGRLNIGGEGMVIHLTKEACVFTRAFEFPDFQSQKKKMLQSFTRAAL